MNMISDGCSPMKKTELIYVIGLTIIPGIGHITAKKLISYCGSAQAVFREKKGNLLRIPGIGEIMAKSIVGQKVLHAAEKELGFIDRFRIRPLYFEEEDYPARLKQCIDGPLLLFVKGNTIPEGTKIISIVGSRNATAYGKGVCRKLVESLRDDRAIIISGLAYGIDTAAHKAALENGLDTFGVLAHGLDRIYPAANKKLAGKMIRQGGLITDFISGTNPDRENFPSRNRIVAGLADAIIVIEAAERGGALITADLANSYNREVFAVPGRWSDPFSAGCNILIRENKAALIQNPEDLRFMMGWSDDKKPKTQVPQQLFVQLSPDEDLVYKILQENGDCGIDLLRLSSGLANGKIANALLNLELQSLILALPGKQYRVKR